MKKIFLLFFTLVIVLLSTNICKADNDTIYSTLNYGEAYTIGDSVITYSGTFKFKKSGSSTDYNIYIITFEPINTSSQSCEVNIIGDSIFKTTTDTIITLSVNDTTMDFYEWYPLDSNDKQNILTDKESTTIQLKVHTQDTAIYILKSMKEEEENVVYNGTFDEGNKGFWSDYTYTSESGASGYSYGLGPEGRYAVGSNPKYYHNDFCDFTSSSYGSMLIANGNQGTDKKVYSATFDVEHNQNYIVTFDAVTVSSASCTATGLPKLQFSVGGTKLGDIFTTSSTNCTWGQYYQIWNSGENDNATITILNQNTIASGNDFAIDNITFRKMCTSYDTIKIINDVHLHSTIEETICQGESYEFDGKQLTEAGSYNKSMKTANNIDSIVTLILHVNSTYEIYLDTSICEDGVVSFNNQQIYQEGSYKAQLKTIDGCDSIVYLTVNVMKTSYDTISEEIFAWQDYYFDNVQMSQSGTYTLTTKNSLGCDSIVTLNLVVNDKVYQSEEICDGESLVFGNNTLTTSGIYMDTLQASNGNDSIIVLSLTVYPSYSDTLYETIPDGQVYDRQGFSESVEGIYSHNNTTIHGCDSSITLNLTVVKEGEIWVPTAFTPSADNNNELKITFSNDSIDIVSFKVFGRWGGLLFETTDKEKGWDGKYKDEPCQQGVYIYEIDYYNRNIKGKTFKKSGEFMLLH
jgi:gliding motility-associated-like protein